MSAPRKAVGGFTLVEVMVALFVVALSLPALMFTLSQQVDGTAHLRDKSIAHAVASNKLAELRLLALAQGDLLRGEESGVAREAGRDWYWWVDSEVTEVALFYRVEIAVAASEDARTTPLYTLVAFMPADFRTDDGVTN